MASQACCDLQQGCLGGKQRRPLSALLEFRTETIQSLSRLALETELKSHKVDLRPGQQLQAEILRARTKRMGRTRQRSTEQV